MKPRWDFRITGVYLGLLAFCLLAWATFVVGVIIITHHV